MPVRKVHFATDCYYHVYNRGSEKRTIFLSTNDHLDFLKRTKESAHKFDINVLCYCLMPNHFHFLLKQNGNTSLAHFLNIIQLGYAKYFNTKYKRVGPLFQGRFKAKQIDTDEYLLQVSAYIHKNIIASQIDSGNPKDSRKIIHQLREFPYSSYREYLGLTAEQISQPTFILDYFAKTNPNLTYETFVENFKTDYEAIVPLLAHIN